MKKTVLRLSAVLLLLLILIVNVFAATIPSPTNDFFVNDFADVISQNDKAEMQAKGETLYKKCGAQVVVATVKNMDGRSIEDYSLEMARSWEIGDSEKDNGILLLLSVEDRKVRIEVGRGLEGALPDSKTGRILDTYGMDYFRSDDFSNGLAAVYDSLVNEVYIKYGLEPENGYEPIDDYSSSESIELEIIIALVVLYLIFSVFSRRFFRKRGRYRHFGTFFSGGGFSGKGGFSGGGGSFGGGGSSRGF